MILNWNQKDYDLIPVDPNQTGLNQPIPNNLTNIGSIHDSDNICAIDKILALPVHYLVHASQIFTYEIACDPTSPLHDSLADSVTPIGNPKPRKNSPNPVPNVPADLDSEPKFSDSLFLESSNSSEDEHYK